MKYPFSLHGVFPVNGIALAVALSLASGAHAQLEPLDEGDMREVTGGSALQYSATDISYNLSQLTGVRYRDKLLGGYERTEMRTPTERVDATVHRLQINGTGELHAYAEEFTLGDYGGSNNSIYKNAGQGIADNQFDNFGFGNSADDPFYFEDPYIEVQKQRHADGSESIRGVRIGFGKAEGHVPLTINSATGYISTLSLLPDLNGIVKAQVYGTGTKDTFVSLLNEIPDGSGNYPQFGDSRAPSNTSNGLNAGLGTVLDPILGLLDPLLNPLGIDPSVQRPGGKELNLSHVRSLDFHNVENFYISLTQGGGNSFVNDDGSVNGALWSQHIGPNAVIPETRADLPGFNMVMPFNDPSNPRQGFVEASVDLVPALSQILLGAGDDNPRQSYQPVF